MNSDYCLKYKKYSSIKYSETCTEVGATIVAEYYNRYGYGKTSSNKNTIFRKYMDFAIDNGAYRTSKQITWCVLFPYAIDDYYAYYDLKLKGNHDVSSLASTIAKYNKNKKPVTVDCKAPNGDCHTVTVFGYNDYNVKVTWENTSGTQSKSGVVRYYTINDGWHDATLGQDLRVQYISSEYLTCLQKIK